MSEFSVSALLPEDGLQCPLCLDVFSDPVTTPCGHNFCKACLSRHWGGGEICHCPECNKRFYERPEVSTNTTIQQLSVQIKRRRLEALEASDAPWRVKCDVCTWLKASKSCLVCLTSYCDAHLEPHLRVPLLMRHKLVEPVEDLERRVCEKHERILEFFCRDEQVCICLLCRDTTHKDHQAVPLEEEAAQQKEKIEPKKEKIKVMIEERMEKIKEFTESSEMSREKVSKEIESSEKLFNTLTDHVQAMRNKLTTNIREKLRKSHAKDEAMIRQLQEEIADLQRKHQELDRLSQSADHVQLLQALQPLSTFSGRMDWSTMEVYSDLCLQSARRAVSHLVKSFQAELKSLTNTELTRMRQYKESVTFNPSTAGCGLVVSEFGKRLKFIKNASPPSPDTSQRFRCPVVLGTKGFTSGRHYWEVQVGQRNDWDVGVAKETVDRTQRNLNKNNGFFAIGKRGRDYKVNGPPYTVLHLSPSPRYVGVYLDYEEGRVSFYDVGEKLHIHSFCRETFTERLFPYFYLSFWAKKSEPLVIRSLLEFPFPL